MPDSTEKIEVVKTQAGSFLELADQYGLGLFLAVGVFICAIWLVRFIIVKLTKELEEQRKSREAETDSHTKTMNRHIDVLDSLEKKIQAHQDANREAHTYQRTEHTSIIGVLKEMQNQQNDFKDKLFEKLNQ